MLPIFQARRQCSPTRLDRIPIGQTGVMSSDQIGQNPPVWSQLFDRMNRSGSRVIDATLATFDMGFWVVPGFETDVVLKRWPIFPQVMPKPRQGSPICSAESLGKTARQL